MATIQDLTFYSVDVEATSTSLETGELLSVGARGFVPAGPGATKLVPVDAQADFYVRIARPESPWRDEDAAKWWADQAEASPVAHNEIFNDALPRLEHDGAGRTFVDWVDTVAQSDDPMTRIFVANPVSYDWPWIERLIHHHGGKKPGAVFSYRTICLRSVAWGLGVSGDPSVSWRATESEVPHHALHDAIAQGVDLCNLFARLRGSMEG